MGLLVTLHLISSNVYGSLNAPLNRGFSYIEVWGLGTQGTILLAIMEYGFILLCMRFQERKITEEKFRTLDLITFILSIIFFVGLNNEHILLVHNSESLNCSILVMKFLRFLCLDYNHFNIQCMHTSNY